MRFKELAVLCAFTALGVGAAAQDITGTILIKRKLTKPSVTPSVSVYQRGPTVKLGKDAEEDPISYELSRVILYLEGPGSSGEDASKDAVPQVQQIDRRFQPDLVVVPIGSTVSFPNMDPIFHDIYSLSKPKTFDLRSYDKGQTRKVIFSKPGIVDIYCHLHPNMAATIVVAPNRWYARPDRTGKFRISNVLPGQYTVVAWHKSAGFFRKSIVIENDHDTVADFFIPLEVDAKPEANSTGNQGDAGGAK